MFYRFLVLLCHKNPLFSEGMACRRDEKGESWSCRKSLKDTLGIYAKH